MTVFLVLMAGFAGAGASLALECLLRSKTEEPHIVNHSEVWSEREDPLLVHSQIQRFTKKPHVTITIGNETRKLGKKTSQENIELIPC